MSLLPTRASPRWPAWVGVVLLAGSVLWLAFSAYRKWIRPGRGESAGASHLVAISGILRGPLPFEAGDTLEGRDIDIRLLTLMVRALGFRFGYLSGKAGAGKTSLLRAGLADCLRNDIETR